MTKQEITYKRPGEFSQWIRTTLPDSSQGYCVTDIDWVFFDFKKRKIMLAEEKTRGKNIAEWMTRFLRNIIDPALREFCPKKGFDYCGIHFIKFEQSGPLDGRIFFDNFEITAEELRKILSFELEPPEKVL